MHSEGHIWLWLMMMINPRLFSHASRAYGGREYDLVVSPIHFFPSFLPECVFQPIDLAEISGSRVPGENFHLTQNLGFRASKIVEDRQELGFGQEKWIGRCIVMGSGVTN